MVDHDNNPLIIELYKNFSRLLYDLTEHYNAQFNKMESQYMARIKELENLCHLYEQRLTTEKYSKGIKLRFKEVIFYLKAILQSGKAFIKKLSVKAAKFIFHLGKVLTIRFGIKDKLKRNYLFRKLYNAGIIDKLRR